MLSKTCDMSVRSAAPGVIPEPITGPVTNGAVLARDPDASPEQATAHTATGRETRGGRFRRKAHRSPRRTSTVSWSRRSLP